MFTVTVVELTAKTKSCTVTATVAECVREPLAPVAVTTYLPAEPEHDRVEVVLGVEILRTTLAGENVHVKPVEGETVAEREMAPLKP